MSQIEITLPDGSKKAVEAGSSPLDVAKSIGQRLADAAIVAKIDGELADLARPIEKDAAVRNLSRRSPNRENARP